ncbi:unnamed protein product [Wuchereria bancrofti]|uniref:Uncharacterized protein n=1 Tax=Wuchereria bancrofti TaxID=6293 RepID=A0A3P7DDS0_WUCBA|nr:unnamed protein product [Wuchereria bancrofti]
MTHVNEGAEREGSATTFCPLLAMTAAWEAETSVRLESVSKLAATNGSRVSILGDNRVERMDLLAEKAYLSTSRRHSFYVIHV